MSIILIAVFILGYAAIAFEHRLRIDKAAIALITGIVCWTLLYLFPGSYSVSFFSEELSHHLSGIAEILFFLLGAMTIVELIDAHDGFQLISSRITPTKKVKLLWTICLISFFLSAVLDNLTCTIVMVSLCRKLIADQKDRWFFCGLIVIAANAGGAWSPIGDVTTTMLWIDGQITASGIIQGVFLESLVSLAVPLILLSLFTKGEVQRPALGENTMTTTAFERNSVFALGISILLLVPVFKTLTHLPPYMGILLGLGLLWTYTEIIHRAKNSEERNELSVVGVIRRIDTPSILFFLGILLAVGTLETSGELGKLATALNQQVSSPAIIASLIGAFSAIVDNVPLVAASSGMYAISEVGVFAQDGSFWQLLAFTAGTGGSMLIIGSAAGVAAMGLEKISFGWYLKHISWLALIGYLAGIAVFLLKTQF